MLHEEIMLFKRKEGENMATQRFISTSFWTDKWVRSLDPSERYIYMYLLTNPQTNIAGVYQITLDRISFDTGYNEKTLGEILKRFGDNGKAYYYMDEWVIIPSWPKHQKADTKSLIRKGIDNVLSSVPYSVLTYMVSIGYQYDINIGSISTELLNSNSDINLNSDTNSDNNENPERNFLSEFDHVRNRFEEITGIACRRPLFQYSDSGEIMNSLKLFSPDEINKALDNYAQLIKSGENEYKYGLPGFLAKGVPRFLNWKTQEDKELGEDNAKVVDF